LKNRVIAQATKSGGSVKINVHAITVFRVVLVANAMSFSMVFMSPLSRVGEYFIIGIVNRTKKPRRLVRGVSVLSGYYFFVFQILTQLQQRFKSGMNIQVRMNRLILRILMVMIFVCCIVVAFLGGIRSLYAM